MIINEIKPNLEMSSEMEAKPFDVKDLGFLFEILRNKMYGNPQMAIVRELASNAIDAHREAGKPNEPIQITLPNAIEPTLRIQDFGVGISPDRVEDIYRWYGASTKRGSNEQIGAMGLGAKIGFSYVDQWSVETIYDHIKYCYAAVIDPTKVGKIVLLSKEATDLSNGTTVIIPIKPADFNSFAQNVEFVCRHFSPLPIIKGGKIHWQTPNYILEGTNWKISPSSGYSRQPRLLIDVIEYPLDLAQLPNSRELDIFYSVNGDTTLAFKTGDLTLSASREAVHLDEPTIKKIATRAKEAYKELHQTIQTKIDDCKTLKEAYIAYAKLDTTIVAVKKLSWNGTELAQTLYVPGMEEWSSNSTLAGYRSSYIRFNDSNINYPLYINDLTEKSLTRKSVNKLFEINDDNDQKPSRVLIVNSDSSEEWKEKLDKKVADLHLEELGATYLSEVISLDPEKPVKPRMTVFRFHPTEQKFKRVAYIDYEADKKTKVLCTLYKDKWNKQQRFAKYQAGTLTGSQISFLLADEPVSIYGLDEIVKPAKIKQFFKGCKKLDAFIDGRLSENGLKERSIQYRAYEKLLPNGGLDAKYGSLQTVSDKLNDEIKRIFAAMKGQQDFISKHYNDVRAYEGLVGYVSAEEVDAWIKEHTEVMVCNKELEKVFERYPLLSVLDYYGWNDNVDDVVEYMRLIDARDAMNKGVEELKTKQKETRSKKVA